MPSKNDSRELLDIANQILPPTLDFQQALTAAGMIGKDTLRQIQATQQEQHSNALPIAVGNPPEFSNRQATAQEMIDRGFSIVSPAQAIDMSNLDNLEGGITPELFQNLFLQVAEPRVYPSRESSPHLDDDQRTELTYIDPDIFPETTIRHLADVSIHKTRLAKWLIQNRDYTGSSHFALVRDPDTRVPGIATVVVSGFTASMNEWQNDPKIMWQSPQAQRIVTLQKPTPDQITALIRDGAKFSVRKVLAKIPPYRKQ